MVASMCLVMITRTNLYAIESSASLGKGEEHCRGDGALQAFVLQVQLVGQGRGKGRGI